MSLSSVHGTLSSLKTCQTDIGTGMDTITDVALDLVETQGNSHVLSNLESMMDDEITVTQTQVNLTCPLTKMVNPVKNKKCSHNYDQEAILSLITNKQKQKKTCCCPVVGCANSDVRQMDLVPDQVLRRMIQSQKRQGTKT
uniref:E3 SUMO-protein ligase NSE2 n=1 Tax=Takifugu rubripes TaxID=31033 RepID=H2SNG2_TAKRU